MKLVLMPAGAWETGLLAEMLGVPESWAPGMLRLLRRGGAMLLYPWLGG
jgi:hypothetical protein